MCMHNFLTSDGAYATARRRKGRKKEKRKRELERKEGRKDRGYCWMWLLYKVCPEKVQPLSI